MIANGSDIGRVVVREKYNSIYCGDGIVEEGEYCDDGNRIDGDGCEADCQLPDQFFTPVE